MRYVDFESVTNYYERMVRERIMADYADGPVAKEPGALEDMACLALNQLPPRYMRYAIDTTFYLTAAELAQMQEEVGVAVQKAADFVLHNPRKTLTVV